MGGLFFIHVHLMDTLMSAAFSYPKEQTSIKWMRLVLCFIIHVSLLIIYIGYIPSGKDVIPVISCGKEQCLSEAEEIWGLHESCAIS